MLHSACDLSLSLSLSVVPLFSLSLPLLHSSTFTSLPSVCQHFPSGGVRHGVRVPGLPASASSHCDLQPRHLSSVCQCHSRPLLGIYTRVDSLCQEKSLFMLFGPLWIVTPSVMLKEGQPFLNKRKSPNNWSGKHNFLLERWSFLMPFLLPFYGGTWFSNT